MAKKTKNNERLGSGLAAIFGDDVNSVLDEIQNNAKNDEYGSKTVLNVHDIRSNPYQPRKTFDETALQELAQSIKENGVFTPILVRKSIGGYELIAGERRLKASIIAGKEEIPAIVMDFDDKQMMEISLLENIQREDLNIVEEANGYNKLIQNLGYTQEQLADRLGKSRTYVTNVLRLLKLPQDVLKMVEDNQLTMGHVRPLITLKPEKISEIALKAVKEGLSVRQVEQLAAEKKDTNKPINEKSKDPYIKDVQKTLAEKFSTKVKITANSINISYHNTDELNRILEILEVIE
ncbi:MAG: ParB/RepB/Spo0J family partition protein [Erysipelotrichia bacterium]|nr:ParB/RepB/Spo0J family partition protein [Erysipelotrichia bacterium]